MSWFGGLQTYPGFGGLAGAAGCRASEDLGGSGGAEIWDLQ